MKRYTIIFILLVIFGKLFAQYSGENYIHTKTYTNESGTKSVDVIQYFDGLGRPTQTVQRGITPDEGDLTTLTEYDSFGRKSHQWLPTPTYGDGNTTSEDYYKSLARSYYSNQSPYSSPVYESSPLNRILKQYGPGENWHDQGKAIETNYLTNNSNYPCVYFKVNQDNNRNVSLSKNGNYSDNQLYVTEMKDEDGNLSYEFKDKLGQVILTRQINNGQNVDTYYVYDDYGNLCYVIPPLLSDKINKEGKSTTDDGIEMKEYAYLYKYDYRNRCIEKRLPGCQPIYYVYDKADQLILSQDGEQRKEGKWAFIKYDALGRVVITGVQSINGDHNTLREKYKNDVITEYAIAEVPGPAYGYTWNKLEEVNYSGVMTVNYYDFYWLLNQSDGRFRYQELEGYGKWHNQSETSHKGLLTAVRDIYTDGSGENIIFMYYDEKGRVIQTRSTNHMGGWEYEYTSYNFTGQALKKLHEHTTPNSSVRELYTYDYDHAGRLITTTHQLDNNSPVILAQNEYDELGRLKSSTANNSQQLKTEYTYNIRSWVNTIRNYHFHEDLAYTYNGNVTSMQWKHSGTGKPQKYDFKYDNLSRLTQANYTYVSNPYYPIDNSVEYNYDKHGNPTRIVRWAYVPQWGNSSPVDELALYYNGNQIRYADESGYDITASTGYDFKRYVDGNYYDYSYTFNANGAMTHDPYKGVTTTYDNNNMPKKIRVVNTVTKGDIEYVYSASGQRLKAAYYNDKKISISPNPTIPGRDTEPQSRISATPARDFLKRTDYVGNKIYKTVPLKLSTTITTLEKIITDNGYIEDGIYYFYAKDHLGNNRIVANLDGAVVQWNDYYPFGMPFAEGYGQETQRFKFGGKEFDTMHGLNQYDFHARQYDMARLQFTTPDPHAETYYSWSLYAYCMNNPMKYADPTGMDTLTVYLPEVTTSTKAPKSGTVIGQTIDVTLLEHIDYREYMYELRIDHLPLPGGSWKSMWQGIKSIPSAIKNIGSLLKTSKDILKVNPKSLIRTETGRTWKSTTKNVAKIMESARTKGITDAVEVYEYGGKMYILNGHHRVEAAIRLGQDVPIKIVKLPFGGYNNPFEVQQAANNAAQNSFKVDGRFLNSLIGK